MRAVLDVNILVAALLSKREAPAELIRRSIEGAFELVVSEALLDELERALSYPKVRQRLGADVSTEFLVLLRSGAAVARDPDRVPRRSVDPADDYLLALAEQQRAILVSGDRHLLDLVSEFPVENARTFLERLTLSNP